MNKSIKKSLYICAAALMIGGVAPTVSNSISASAHSRTAISRYSHKKNVRKSDVKRLHHIQNVHKYHLRLEKEAKRNLAKHEKSLARYNHLIHVHKHNRKMINNLTRAKRKLIKMVNKDQHGITRQASLVESEEHQIDLIKHGKIVPSNAKKGRHGHKGNYSGKGYNYWLNLGKHSHRAKGPKGMNHWENRAFIAGYNSTHHKPRHHINGLKNNSYLDGLKLGRGEARLYNRYGSSRLQPHIVAPNYDSSSDWYRGFVKGFNNTVNINRLHVSYYYENGKLHTTTDVAGYRDNGPRPLIGGNGEHPYPIGPAFNKPKVKHVNLVESATNNDNISYPSLIGGNGQHPYSAAMGPNAIKPAIRENVSASIAPVDVSPASITPASAVSASNNFTASIASANSASASAVSASAMNMNNANYSNNANTAK